MEKFKLLDNSHHILMDKLKERLVNLLKPSQLEKIDKISELCPEVNDEMNCDKAKSLHKCLIKL